MLPDEPALKKAKHSGKAYLKINDSFSVDDVTGLPTPFELTADPRWNEDGELYRLYDLALDRRPIVEYRASEKVDESDLPEDELVEEHEEEKQEFTLVSFCGWIVKLAANTEAWSSTFSSFFNPAIHLIRSDDTSICCG